MKIETLDNSKERRIVIGLITDKAVLSQVQPKWNGELLRSKWSNLVCGWAVDYFKKYGEAPGKAIQGIFESWASDAKDQETIDLVSKFLEGLSNEWDELEREVRNPAFIIDTAASYFNEVSIRRLIEELTGDIDAGKVGRALHRAESFNKVEIGTDGFVDVFKDENTMKEVFDEQRESLIIHEGDGISFYGTAFERDGFIGIMAPEKRGKTWRLLDFAYRAAIQGRRVAFFEVGDMSRNQILRRFYARVAGRPIKPRIVKYPRLITRDPDDEMARVGFEEREFKNGLNVEQAREACQTLMTNNKGESYIRLSVHPALSISVNGIKAILQSWEWAGWLPDFVIIDYPDILAPNSDKMDYLHRIEDTWASLRALSQVYHCCIIAGTQAKATSYKAAILDMTHFSGNKLKFAYVTGMLGLNQTPAEKDMSIMRENWIALREDEFTEGQCIHHAMCLPIGNFSVLNTL